MILDFNDQMTTPGLLITFEGIDGCGKSTQIQLFREYLESRGVRFEIFREPGGTHLSEQIRNLLLHSSGEMNEITELLLFSAARSQLIREKVIPLLEKGDTVILDRFYDSTLAYQGYGRKAADIEKIVELNRLAAHNIVPDLTFYLKISPELAASRTSRQTKDRMENEGLLFFEKVAEGYNRISQESSRFKTIDASGSRDDVFHEISKAFEDLSNR